jgi:hypothetical protein
MKKTALLVFILGCLSVTSGWLLSKASLVGRAGISLFYKEYRFLKTWWQGALTVFIVLILLLLLQGIGQRKLGRHKANILHISILLLSTIGLYFTYYDFRHTTSHRLLGERFHLGAYLFWIGWMIISLFYLNQNKEHAKERRHITVPEAEPEP